MSLLQKHCVPCEGGTLPLSLPKARELLLEVPGWDLSSDGKSISKTYKFRDWKEAVAFVNMVSDIAEAEGHHPDVDLRWGKVSIVLSTHSIGGLSTNDFILAAKIGTIAS